MDTKRLELAGLATRVVEAANATTTAVFLHGFGAPGDDLVGLAPYLAAPLRFVFPEAPLALGGAYGDARAWWLIDMQRIEAQMRAGDPMARTAEIPEGLAEARTRMLGFVDEVVAAFSTSADRIVLGGFSQGAMLALDVALHSRAKLAGLALLSGTLLASPVWTPRLPQLAGVPVFMSHGRHDPLLPFSIAETLRDQLSAAGAAIEWQAFGGGHEIPRPVMDALSVFLRARS